MEPHLVLLILFVLSPPVISAAHTDQRVAPASSAALLDTSGPVALPYVHYDNHEDCKLQPPDSQTHPAIRNWESAEGDLPGHMPTGVKDRWLALSHSATDPELKQLALGALPKLLMSSRAHSTTIKYSNSWKRWESWASSKTGVKSFPVNPTDFALYLSSFYSSGHKTAADSAAAAVAWAHSLAGLPSPTNDPLVKTTIQGYKRLTASTPNRKEPVTPEILAKLYNAHGQPSAALGDLRILFVCFVCYAGFLRFNDISNVRRTDCSILSDSLVIHLCKSKTDQYRQGNNITIARTFQPTCPVVITERYFQAMGDPDTSPLPVLRRMTRSKTGLVPTTHGLSYTRTREIVLEALRPFVPDIHKFGLHSLRSGGASAASKALLPSHLISMHGRWKTEKARNAYIKTDPQTRLLPSSVLGI
ncbi:integrase/recombinase xerD homolog [Asterias amurensis]|uniref:integrase/recombinase xerD homolog n=1 Tax=Asterias amurensis TaxID=7602 RepID=UPI003AB12095